MVVVPFPFPGAAPVAGDASPRALLADRPAWVDHAVLHVTEGFPRLRLS